MFMKIVVVNVCLMVLINSALCIVCTPNICDNVKCKPVENCDGPDKAIRLGFCGCCQQCVTILGENESCSSLLYQIHGMPPPTVECADGLICYENRCQNAKVVLEKAKLP